MKKKQICEVWYYHTLFKSLRIMRLTLGLLLVLVAQGWANKSYSQKAILNLDMKNVNIVQILEEIENQTDFYFLFNYEQVHSDKKIDVKLSNTKINETLNVVLKDTDLKYTISDRQIVLSKNSLNEKGDLFATTSQQPITIKGIITNTDGDPIPGATIIIKGTTDGTISDFNGNYIITNVPADALLVISFVGMKSQEIPVAGKTTVNITLEEETIGLEEVVAIGYGTQRRRDLTGSVGSVKGDEFKNQPSTNPTESLQGRIAGVNIVKSSGAPDAEPNIIIRGLASLNQPNPLYIVDGVRVMNGNTINVQDIATIDVLKDASSAAIYGAAAAGGVIVITTKKGKDSEPKVNFNTRYGITSPKLIDLLDKDGFVRMQNVVNPSYFTDDSGNPRPGIAELPDTDWVKSLYGNAYEQNYNLSISGGTSNVSYLLSGFYNTQEGIYIKNYSNIGGARINTDYKITKWLKIGEQLSISQRVTSPPVGSEAQLHNAPFRTLPVIPVRDSNGDYGVVPDGFGNLSQFGGPNPVATAENASAKNFRNNLTSNVYADITLPFGFSFKTNFSYNYYQQNQDLFQDAFTVGKITISNNSLQKRFSISSQFLSNYVLTWNKSFGNHNINAIAGYEEILNKSNNVVATQSNIGLPGYSFIRTSDSNNSISGSYDANGLIKSEFARVNYNFNNKYYLSASVRQDANFRVFGPNKQRGVFPAASAGWNISEEPFFKSALPFFSRLKIFGSYGELGNSNISPYLFNSSYRQFQASGGIASGAQNFSPDGPLVIANSTNGIPNPGLHWETIQETNIGIDGDLLNGKIYFTAEWYDKNTVNMLYNISLPLSTGFTDPFIANIGKVSSKGFDLLVGFRDASKSVKYDISFTAGFNKNEVVSLGGSATDAIYDGFNYYSNGDAGYQVMSNQNLTITKAGLPFGSFYGYKVLGIFQTDAEAAASPQGDVAHAGDLIFEDFSEDGSISDADKQVIGNPNPKLVYGISAKISYKGFDAAFLFNGVAGIDLFNGVKAYEQYPFSDFNTTDKVFGNSFFEDNGLTSQPRLGVSNDDGSFTLDPNGNYTSVNSYFVENGSYLKLKNLEVGYTFSNTMLQKLKINNIRLFVIGNNLFTITKYSGLDPELGSSASGGGYGGITTRGVDAVSQYPQTRIYSIGADINF